MIFIGWIHTPCSIYVVFSVFHLSLSLSLSLSCELHVGSVGCVSVSRVRRATVFPLGKLFKFWFFFFCFYISFLVYFLFFVWLAFVFGLVAGWCENGGSLERGVGFLSFTPSWSKVRTCCRLHQWKMYLLRLVNKLDWEHSFCLAHWTRPLWSS